MSWGSVLLWGFLATLALTMLLAAGHGLGLSRVSIPYLLGTLVTRDHDRAPAVGIVLHLGFGWVFSLLYALIFESVRRADVWLGLLLGLLHGALVLLVLMPALPGLHPRMASEHRGPTPTRMLEPPGFLALNYGRSTPLLTMIAHGVYGTLLGAFYRL